MNGLVNVFRELAGLFIDDGSLALTISLVVMLAAIVAVLMPEVPIAAGIVLLVGCLGGLFSNVMKS